MQDREHGADSSNATQGRQPGDPFYAEGDRAKNGKKKVKIIMGTDVTPRPDQLAVAGMAGARQAAHFRRTARLSQDDDRDWLRRRGDARRTWPDRTRMAQGNVVIWSGEDAIEDTLMPRFLAAGGDPAHVAFIKGVEEDGTTRGFDPSRDMEALTEVCAALGGVNLIIIDPVVMIAKGDSHKNAETRSDLQPLADLAERTQAAVSASTT